MPVGRSSSWMDFFLKEIIMNTNDKSTIDRDSVTQIGAGTRADLHGAVDRAAGQAQPMADRLATSAHDGIDKVGDTIDDVSDTLLARSKQMGVACQRVAETGRGYVRHSPAMSLLVAAAAGYGLSKLFSPHK